MATNIISEIIASVISERTPISVRETFSERKTRFWREKALIIREKEREKGFIFERLILFWVKS